MLGYNEMKEVLLWAQTTQPAEVQFAYWPKENPKDRRLTDTKQTIEGEAFTAKLIADEVEPGVSYEYELRINGKALKLEYPTEFTTQPLWRWRTDPPEFTVAIGSCNYINEPRYDRPGNGYGGEYGIFKSIFEKRPDAMIWLGDNTYLREVDWFTETGILHRYTHTRSLAEMQPLLASTHHYAIWDDHDFGPNNSDRSFVHKDKTLRAFDLFWGNPTVGLPHQEGGITSYFQYNDMDFFLLDNRYFRSPNNRKTGEQTMLGKAQLEWLIDALVASRAPFKMVCIGGQVLSTLEKYETYANYHWEEREYLLRRIEEEGIRNVVFLTGDRHHTEMSQYQNGAGNMVYDVTCSPLTSGAGSGADEENKLRVEGTLVNEDRNFGVLTFSGPRKERKLTITMYNTEGEELWSRTIE
jgi:alkaline phosphatase D